LRYFQENGVAISLVLVETSTRQKFSAAEREFKAAHAAFTLIVEGGKADQNGNRSFPRSLWQRIPISIRQGVRNLIPTGLIEGRDIVMSTAKELNVPVERVETHSAQPAKDILQQYGISYALLASSNWLIKEPLVSAEVVKVINAHCAKLPQHRSLDALPWSVMENDNLGLTTHFVDAGIDTGPILSFLEVQPQVGDNLNTLRQRVNDKVPELFLKSIVGLQDKTITPSVQRQSEGVHHRPMTIEQLLEANRILQERIARDCADLGKVSI
jgi:folate-dependent phosphoribosylglycinamide formyltransferase PurN